MQIEASDETGALLVDGLQPIDPNLFRHIGAEGHFLEADSVEHERKIDGGVFVVIA